MANILVVYEDQVRGKLPSVAAAVAGGAVTVKSVEVRVQPLSTTDHAALRWCDGLALGITGRAQGTELDLEAWWSSLGGNAWEAVQGKFASVFMAPAPEGQINAADTEISTHAAGLLTSHGMVVTGFSTEAAHDVPHDRWQGHHPLREFERLGRRLAGMVGAYVDAREDSRNYRVLSSLVRATRRVPSVRPAV